MKTITLKEKLKRVIFPDPWRGSWRDNPKSRVDYENNLLNHILSLFEQEMTRIIGKDIKIDGDWATRTEEAIVGARNDLRSEMRNKVKELVH